MECFLATQVYKPGSVLTAIYLAPRLPAGSSRLLGTVGRTYVPPRRCSGIEFTAPTCLHGAGALLPHLSTLTTCVAVSFSMALSLGSLPPDVIRHPALRSSDFPHALRPAIIFPARVLQYSMETEFFQEKDKIRFRVKGQHAP